MNVARISSDAILDGLRVVLVDDNPDDRSLVGRELQREFPGVHISEVTDATGLAAIVQTGLFDLVITDYALRWSDGLQVLRMVQARWPGRPVIMLTGTGNETVAVEAMKAGLADYVLKNADFSRVPVVVRAALRSQGQRAALAAAEARYRELVERLPAIIEISALDRGATRTYVSPQVEQLLGYSPDEWLANPDPRLEGIHPDDRAGVQAAHERQLADFRPFVCEYRTRHRSGRMVWIRDEAIVVRDGAGVPHHVQRLLFDITRQHQAEQDLLQAQKMEAVGRLAAGIAHDFNNLLTVIGGHAQLLTLDLPLSDPRHEDAVAIEMAARRASSLTAQLLAFGRQRLVDPQVLDLAMVVHATSGLLRRLISEQIRLETTTPGDGPRVRMDPAQLEQVLLNLALNARDAMPDGGTLTIEVGYAPESLDDEDGRPLARLSVRDTGSGMDEPTRAQVFLPFFTTKEVGKGTGLGMATVYGIIQAAGGSIGVASELGRGSIFTVLLPTVDLPVSAPDHEPADLAGGGSETVLVVEDDPSVFRVAREILARAGYVVIEAANGHDALAAIEARPGTIDLVLTDLIMPGMHGADLVQVIREVAPEIRILVMSAYADERDLARLDARILDKPFVPAALLTAVRGVLDTPRTVIAVPPA